jgi:TP901 family phage tail tape measure protein
MAADITKTIEVLFEGTNRTGTAITAVGRDLDELNYRVGNVAAPMAALTTEVSKLDAAFGVLAAGGLLLAFNQSTKFESAYIELQKVLGDNVEELQAAKKNALDLSDAYGESAAAILESTASYKQAGFDANESMMLAKAGMDLVIAGGVDASQASEILIASLKGFRAPASEATRLLDIMNEVSNEFATDIEQLGTGMSKLSPIARTMGFSMEETAGLLTPVIEIFRSGDEAAVALKTGLLKLTDDAKPVQEALESIGVSQTDANGALRSGKDILADVTKAFTGLDDAQKLFVTQQLVGIDQSARMVEVFNGLAKSTAVIETAMGAAGSAAKEVESRLASSEVQIGRFFEAMKNLATVMGDEFRVSATGVVSGFTDIFNAIRSSVDDGAFDTIFDALNSFNEDLTETLKNIAENLPEALDGVDFSGFVNSLGDIRETLAGIFDGIDFSDPEDLQRAIQGVIDTFESLVRFSNGVAEIFVEVAKKVFAVIDAFNNLDAGTKEAIGNVSGLASVVSGLAGPIGSVTTAISSFGNVLQIAAVGQVASLTKSLIGTGGLTSAFSVVQAHPLIAAGAAGIAIGTVWRKMVPEVDQAAQSVLGFIDKYTGIFGVEAEHQAAREKAVEAEAKLKAAIELRQQAAEEAAAPKGYDDFLNEVNTATDATTDWVEVTRELGILVEQPIEVKADIDDAEKKFETVRFWQGELESGKWVEIRIPVDTKEIEAAQEEIEKIPAEKKFKIETDLQIEEVKAHAETVQAALEWKAKVDISEAETQAERIKAAFESVSESFADTGKMINSLFGEWSDESSLQEKWAIQEALDREQDRRDEAQKLQRELTEAEIRALDARTERLSSESPLITVNGDGLEPHLEAIMWHLLEAVQVRANEEGLSALLLGAPEGVI